MGGVHAASFADILASSGLLLSNSTDGQQKALTSSFHLMADTSITPTVADAGNAQSGVFILYLWEARQ